MAWEDVEVDDDAFADPEDEQFFDDDGPSDEDVDWVDRLGDRDPDHPFGRVTRRYVIEDRDEDDLPELRLTAEERSVITGQDAREERLKAAQAARAKALARPSQPTGADGSSRQIHREVPPARGRTGTQTRPRVQQRHRVVGSDGVRTVPRPDPPMPEPNWVPGGAVTVDKATVPSVWVRVFGVLILVLICAGIVAGAVLYGASVYGQTAPQTPGTVQQEQVST